MMQKHRNEEERIVDPAKRRCLEGKPRAQIDVSNDAAVRPLVDAGFGAMGRVDVVVSNAGYGLFGAAEEVSNDQEIRRRAATPARFGPARRRASWHA